MSNVFKLTLEGLDVRHKLIDLYQYLLSNKHLLFATKVSGTVIVWYIIRNIYCYVLQEIYKLPPGPFGIPIFGNLLQATDMPSYFSYLASNYGSVSMIYFGSTKYVILHSIDTINELFKDKRVISRDKYANLKHLNVNEYHLVMANDELWKKKRSRFQRIMLKKLNSSFLNTVINYSLNNHVIKSINDTMNNDELWYPLSDITYIHFNIIFNAVFGAYLPYTSHEKDIIIKYINRIFSQSAAEILLKNLRFKYFDPIPDSFVDGYPLMEKEIEQMLYKYCNIDENMFDVDIGLDQHTTSNNDTIASLLLQEHRDNSDGDMKNVKNVILNEIAVLFNTGVHTTIHTIEYSLVSLAKYPGLQELIYKELCENINFERDTFALNQKENQIRSVLNKLHYLCAFMYEVFRLSSVASIGVPHINNDNDDLWINGTDKYGEKVKYKIPIGTVIISDLINANVNDPYWKSHTQNPMEICIDLWLDSNRKFKADRKHCDKMMGFGVGPRECPGADFAKRSLYTLIAKLLLMYRFSLDNKEVKIKRKFDYVMHIEPKIGLKVEKR